MNAIVEPEPDDAMHLVRHKANDAVKSFFADSAGAARGELPKDVGTPDHVFDGQAALDRVDGNRELLRTMIGVFSVQWREFSTEIASAASRRDGAALELVANRLKRSLVSVGAKNARRVARELEEFGCKRRFHDAGNRLAQLRIEIERILRALREFSAAPT